MRFRLLLVAAALPTLAHAADVAEVKPPALPTVLLTKEQLTAIIQAENARAVANYIADEKRAAAKDAYEVVRKAFEAPAK